MGGVAESGGSCKEFAVGVGFPCPTTDFGVSCDEFSTMLACFQPCAANQLSRSPFVHELKSTGQGVPSGAYLAFFTCPLVFLAIPRTGVGFVVSSRFSGLASIFSLDVLQGGEAPLPRCEERGLKPYPSVQDLAIACLPLGNESQAPSSHPTANHQIDNVVFLCHGLSFSRDPESGNEPSKEREYLARTGGPQIFASSGVQVPAASA